MTFLPLHLGLRDLPHGRSPTDQRVNSALIRSKAYEKQADFSGLALTH
jgi:hypothetical protein